MPAGKFTIPNFPSYLPTTSELLGAQLPEYEPGYTGRGTVGLEEPTINEMDLLMALAPILKLGKVPLGALGSMRGSLSNKKLTQAHHTLPIGGQRNLAALDWQLKNLGGEGAGWTTVRDVLIPDHKELTKKQMAKLSKPNLLDMELEDALKYMKSESMGILNIAKEKLKDQSGKLSNKPVSKTEGISPIGPEERADIFTKFKTSPEREQILSKERLAKVEDFLAEYNKAYPKGQAHVFGSVASDNPVVNDLDLLLETPDVGSFLGLNNRLLSGRSATTGKPIGIDKVHLVASPPLEDIPNEMKRIRKMGEKKHGPSYDIIRILSAMGLISPLSGMLGEEEEPNLLGKE